MTVVPPSPPATAVYDATLWRVVTRVRQSGASAGRVAKYYDFVANNHRVRSMREAAAYQAVVGV
jgi:hypothetical protein